MRRRDEELFLANAVTRTPSGFFPERVHGALLAAIKASLMYVHALSSLPATRRPIALTSTVVTDT